MTCTIGTPRAKYPGQGVIPSSARQSLRIAAFRLLLFLYQQGCGLLLRLRSPIPPFTLSGPGFGWSALPAQGPSLHSEAAGGWAGGEDAG